MVRYYNAADYYGYCKRRLKVNIIAFTPEIDCDQTAMGLPPVCSISHSYNFGETLASWRKFWGTSATLSGIKREWYVCMWLLCYFVDSFTPRFYSLIPNESNSIPQESGKVPTAQSIRHARHRLATWVSSFSDWGSVGRRNYLVTRHWSTFNING
jgi:hypothetical protein